MALYRQLLSWQSNNLHVYDGKWNIKAIQSFLAVTQISSKLYKILVLAKTNVNKCFDGVEDDGGLINKREIYCHQSWTCKGTRRKRIRNIPRNARFNAISFNVELECSPRIRAKLVNHKHSLPLYQCNVGPCVGVNKLFVIALYSACFKELDIPQPSISRPSSSGLILHVLLF